MNTNHYQAILFSDIRTIEEKAARLAELDGAQFVILRDETSNPPEGWFRYVGLEQGEGPWAALIRVANADGDILLVANDDFRGYQIEVEEEGE